MQLSPRYRKSFERARLTWCNFAAIVDKVESQGTPREVLSRRISVCSCMVMANTGKINLHSSLSSSSSITGNSMIYQRYTNKQQQHQSQLFQYRYIFRVVSKRKPEKSKLKRKRSSRNEGTRLLCKQDKAFVHEQLRICCSKLPCFMGYISNRTVSRR